MMYWKCNYEKCNGFCCKNGGHYVPLQIGEKEMLYSILPFIQTVIDDKNWDWLKRHGIKDDFIVIDPENGCPFLFTDKSGISRCSIQHLQEEGIIDVLKPISCRLYPIRIIEGKKYFMPCPYGGSAISNGERENVRIEDFLGDVYHDFNNVL